jgi:hypothetical protein
MGIGNVYFNYETIPGQFSNVPRAFNTSSGTLGGVHQGLTGLAAFQDLLCTYINIKCNLFVFNSFHLLI